MYGTDGMMNTAMAEGRYFTNGTDATNSPGGLGANLPNGQYTFIDGDFVLGPGSLTDSVDGDDGESTRRTQGGVFLVGFD